MSIDNPFTMVVLIVAIVFGAKLWRTQMLMRARLGNSEQDRHVVDSMQRQIDTLQTRVSVLERLVTDDDRKLAGEIERLRDVGRSDGLR
jgi:hypothetical protein